MQKINLSGYKLDGIEVYNWGIFDKKIHEFHSKGENGLLTGDIGSGKSTLIDAITTLIVPPRKVSFNLAAGAGNKERSIDTYFYGHYTSKNDDSGRSRPVGLRQNGEHISVLLAKFKDGDLGKEITLASVFWFKSSEGKVNRFNVVHEGNLTIQTDFTDFGGKILDLKKRLRNKGAEIFDGFSKYAQHFSKLLGLGTDLKALELFNRTISMKSIGSVTEFTRENILERPDVEGEIEKLSSNYEDLNRLHETIVIAKSKIEKLIPIVQAGEKAVEEKKQERHLQAAREVIDAYVADIDNKGFQSFLDRSEKSLSKKIEEQKKLKSDIENLNDEISSLQQAIRDSGGSRIEDIKSTIRNKEKIRDTRLKLATLYENLCLEANITSELTANDFNNAIDTAKNTLEKAEKHGDTLRDKDREISISISKIEHDKNIIDREVDQLKLSESNIDGRLLNLRALIAEGVGIEESKLPFVGELIRVKESEKPWQGAIERVLRSFALSMLVPEDVYDDVLKFINNTHLYGKLVYYRVTPVSENNYRPDANLLCNKLDMKHTAQFSKWLEHELYSRFDHVCCEDHTKLRHYQKSVSLTGQIKSGRSRHEKDDSYNINDRSRFVLGWNNEEKRIALTENQHELQKKLSELLHKRSTTNKELSLNQSRISNNYALSKFSFSFTDCDWMSVANEISDLDVELKELSESSTTLKDLNRKIEQAKAQYRQLVDAKSEVDNDIGGLKNKIETVVLSIEVNSKVIEQIEESVRAEYFPFLTDEYEKILKSEDIEIRSNDKLAFKFRKWINNRIQRAVNKTNSHINEMQKAITQFFIDFHEESLELDQSLESLPEFKARLNSLMEEDLPRHENAFKLKMQQETIQHMAMFQSRLNGWKNDMENVIVSLNDVLLNLTYNKNPDTYIKISCDKVHDEDIRSFQQDIQAAIAYIGDEELYSEQKFTRIQQIVQKLQEDERWRLKVVDVRNWMRFSAIECYRETDEQKEAYSDSDGKSGGQKEKLAYLCLASAIILQYGLLNSDLLGSSNRPRFNLVIIDEAFIRGSKESTKFGLELFKSLGLQLILVTPLMKLDIISQYISNVGYVEKKVTDASEERSRILNMPIAKYLDLKRNHDSHAQEQVS